MSFNDLSPNEKDRYIANIKANSGKKKEFTYINKKGERSTPTRGRFLQYFKVYEDGPPIPDSLREKMGLGGEVGAPPKPKKGSGYEKLVEKYSEQIKTKSEEDMSSSKEEDDPKKSDAEILDEIKKELMTYAYRIGGLDEFQRKKLQRWEAFVFSKLEDSSLDKKLRTNYEGVQLIIDNEKNFDDDVRAINSIKQQLVELKRYDDPPQEEEEINTLQVNLLNLYKQADYLSKDPDLLKPFADKWKFIKEETTEILARDFGVNPASKQSRPNELSDTIEEYKVQEIKDLQEKYKRSERDEKDGIPTNEVTEEDVLIISSDAPLGTEPELIVKEKKLTDTFMFDEPLTETTSDYDYPDITLRKKDLVLPDISFTAADVDIAAADTSQSDSSQPESINIDETVVNESESTEAQQTKTELGPRAEVKYVFEVKYHKSQIAEYFFVWNQPAWDQQLSDSIKGSESMYTKEYLLSTMSRLIVDPRFKIDKVITTVYDKMIDILTEYHEISQIQFCIQRNMQTGKREKLIGMKLKDLVNIASIASGQPAQSRDPNEVAPDDSVSQSGSNEQSNEQMQPTPTAPNIIDPERPSVVFPRDKEITMYEIGEKATKLLDSQNKIKDLNLKLISDSQRNSGADVIIGPMNEQVVQRSGINIEALRRVMVDF